MNAQKKDEKFRNGYKNPKRLAAIHNYPCVVCFAKGLKQTTRTIAHHKIGMGLGKKASDELTMILCEKHHTGSDGIHSIPLHRWEDMFFTQDECIELTNKMLENET
jgi:hypothetical protein